MEEEEEPGFTLVKPKKASRRARTAATTTEGPGSTSTTSKADPRSSSRTSEPESVPSGSAGTSGVAKSSETAAGRRGQAADTREGPVDPQAGAAAPVAMPVASGSAGPAAVRKTEKGPSGCWICGKEGHYRSNCPNKGKKEKRKRSVGSGQTPEGKQAKTEGNQAKTPATRDQKPDFNWSKVTLVLLNKDGQPLTLEEYEEVKGNFVLKEVDLALREGILIDINQWSWYQDRAEVKFANVVSIGGAHHNQ